jgi:hypothetical protein
VHRVVRIDQEGNCRGVRNQFPEDFYLFGGPISRYPARKTGDVTAWTREALDETEAHGLGHNLEMGRALISAKRALEHGEFTRMIEHELASRHRQGPGKGDGLDV